MRRILWLVLGMAMGAALGASHTDASTRTPRIIGGDGYLTRWDVIDANGEVLCSDPYVWTSTSELECDTE